MNAEHRKSVEEIIAERAGLDPMAEITVGGRDQPDIGPKRRRAADPFVLPFLQHAEQLRLDRRGEIADLIEEERAAGGDLEATALETIGAGERSSLMSEELGLRQRFGQCGAVDRHERPVGTSAGVVDGASDQLLPGPAFAREQDRCLLPGDQGCLVQGLANGSGAPHDAIESVPFGERSPQTFHPAFEPAAVLLGRGHSLLFLGQALVLERDHHLSRDPGDHLGVTLVEPVGVVCLANASTPPSVSPKTSGATITDRTPRSSAARSPGKDWSSSRRASPSSTISFAASRAPNE